MEISLTGTHRVDQEVNGEATTTGIIMVGVEIKVRNDFQELNLMFIEGFVTGGWFNNQQYGGSNADGSGDANQQWMAYYQVRNLSEF